MDSEKEKEEEMKREKIDFFAVAVVSVCKCVNIGLIKREVSLSSMCVWRGRRRRESIYVFLGNL